MFNKNIQEVNNDIISKDESFYFEKGKRITIIVTPSKNYFKVHLWDKNEEFMPKVKTDYDILTDSFKEAMSLKWNKKTY